jgi:hypothetical protein
MSNSPGFRPSHNTHEAAGAAAAATFFSNNSNSKRPPSPNGATAPKLSKLPKNTEIGKPALYIPSGQPGGYKSKKRITHKRRHTRRHRGRTRSRR